MQGRPTTTPQVFTTKQTSTRGSWKDINRVTLTKMYNPKRSIGVLKSEIILRSVSFRVEDGQIRPHFCVLPPPGRPSSSLLNGAKECYEKILKAPVNTRPCQLFINHAM